MDYPKGLDPYIARQHLLHHTYSPLISIQSSLNADVLFQTILNNNDISTLQIFKPYGNNAKYSIPNQSFKITSTQLITKNYPSFPIRFEPSLPELLSAYNTTSVSASNSSNVNSSSPIPPSITSTSTSATSPHQQLNQLFSISSLEVLLKHLSLTSHDKELYLTFLNKIITSNKIVPFETFNHPISQIFVIDFEKDTVENLRKMIVDFRNFNFPKFYQIDDLLIHTFILFDSNKFSNNDLFNFQNQIKSMLNINSSIIPITESTTSDDIMVKLSIIENSTIEEDLQRIALQEQSTTNSNPPSNFIQIPKSIDSVLRHRFYDFINKYLIPHMQSKIRIWDDQRLQPKKSITGRLFSASRKLFNNNSDSNLSSSTSSTSSGVINSAVPFNSIEHYYHKSSSEQIIRKLADWSLILKDFKYAYSTYDLIKKDYTNDKAWVYVASIQEMCIVSLLLAQTQEGTVNSIDKSTLRRIRYDIIEPYIDNLSYTFKSRLNIKTYSFKTLLITVELLLCISTAYNVSWFFNDMIERYLLKLINEFDSHLSTNNPQAIRAVVFERLGYCLGKCTYISDQYLPLLKMDNYNKTIITHEHEHPKDVDGNDVEIKHDDNDSLYKNPQKLFPTTNTSILGLTRFRKSSLWYLLSMKEWIELKRIKQIPYLLNNIKLIYDIDDTVIDSENWYDRSDLLLGFIKKYMKESESNKEVDNE
ncbi:ER-golgi trafficking TRAPP I complex 85 kDa subunit-domain-containing protein [Scheffersomyces coipomensis]|uniref:ER-golgi trafficking TRAPP I complex 85 kDa subunit-domain-containing protein n=1 Tax=Scheffersomyces coipomensis TaxID=1788519 RepID=UPI00315D2F5E